jgi:hypothetical protein
MRSVRAESNTDMDNDFQMPERPLSFPEVQTAWELARSSDSYFKGMSLGDYAKFMNTHLGTTAYSAGDVGVVGGAVKNISTGLDESLRPASEATGDVGASIGRLIGPTSERVGRAMGEGLPRMAADAGLVMGGLAAAPFTGGGSLLLTGAGMADAGAKTYTDTGSPAAGALVGASQLLIPGAGRIGGQVGAKLATPVAERLATGGVGDVLGGLVKAGGEYVGSQVAMLPVQEAVNQGVSKLATGEWHDSLSPENIGQTIAGVLPFAALDVVQAGKTARGFVKQAPVARDVAAFQAQRAAQPPGVSPEPSAEPRILPNTAKQSQDFAATMTMDQLQSELAKTSAEIAALPKATSIADLDARAPLMQKGSFLREAIRIQEYANTPEAAPIAKKEMVSHLTELEKDGADPVQLSRSMVESAPVVAVGETPESAAYRLAGFKALTERPASPDELLLSTQAYFTRLYELRGSPPERVAALTRQAMIVAARFRGTEKVTMGFAHRDNVDNASFATAQIGEWKRQFIAVLGEAGWKSWEDAVGADALERFSNIKTTAHELMHSVQMLALTTPEGAAIAADPNLPDPHRLRNYMLAYKEAQTLTPDEKAMTLNRMWANVVPKQIYQSKPFQEYLYQRQEAYGLTSKNYQGNAEFLADFAGLAATASPKSMGDATLLYGNATLGFMRGLYQDLANVFAGVRSLFEQADNKRAAKAVTEVHENVRKLLRTAEEAEARVDAFLALGQRAMARAYEEPPALSYEEMLGLHKSLTWDKERGVHLFADPAVDALQKEVAELVVPQQRELGGKRLGVWDYLTPVVQLAQKYPMLKPVVWLANAQRAMVSANTLKLWEPFVDAKGKIDHKLIKQVGVTDTAANRLLNKVALQQNVEQKTIWTKDEILARFPEFGLLKEPDQKAILSALPKFGQTAHAAAIMRVGAHRAETEHAMARILQAQDRAMTFEEALKLGQKAVKATWDVGSDDIGSTVAEADLRSSGLPGTSVDRVMDAAKQNYAQNLQLAKQLLGEDGKGKPWYFPEVRLGDWFLAWQEVNGKPQVVGYKSKAEATAKFQALQAQQAAGKLKYLKDWNKSDKAEKFHGLTQEMVDAYKEADQRLYDSVLAAVGEVGDKDTIEAIREEFQPGAGTTAVSTSPYMLERQLVGGRETLNMVEGMLHYINATSNGLAKKFVKSRQAVTLQDPSLRANPNVQNFAKRYLNSITDPPAKELTTMKNLVFWNYMGLNPSSLPIEAAQQMSTLVPFLVNKGAGAGEAYSRVFAAGKDVLASRKTGKYADPELQKAVERARAERTVDTGIAQELYAAEDVDFVNTRNLLAGGGREVNARQMITRPAYHMLKLARDFYGLATTFNSESAFVASYRYAKEKLGMKPGEAEVFAKDATYATMFGGGTANRPAFAYGLGKTQGVVGLALSLQGYTLNSLAFMARMSKRAIMDSKLDPADKLAARKAAGLMFGTQALLGGAMGLPLVGGALALIDEVFPEAQTKKNLRSAFYGLVGDDNESLGHMIADGAMNGVFNAIPGGPDIGARFQLGSLMGVSPYDGFSWKNLAGPAASMLGNYVKAGKELVSGDVAGAVQDASPAGLKGLVRLIADDGAVKDRQGRLMFEANNAERAMLALGFKPKRYNQMMEQQKMLAMSEKASEADSARFHGEVADALAEGNSQEVQRLLYTRQMEQPGYDVQAGIRKAAEIVQQRVTPQDPIRGASLANQDAATIARLYPRGRGPSEVQKLQSSWQLQSASGIPVAAPTSRDFNHAAMLDAIMQANPKMTRVQAAAIAQRMSSRGAQTSFMRYGAQGPVAGM